MEKQTVFSEDTINSLKYYVYALIDPRDNKPFYYGKGIGNRVYSHEREATENKEEYSNKINKIREIENAGYQVIRQIVNGGFETENEAFAAECALINNAELIGIKLTNIVGGHHSIFGTVEDIEIEYGNHPIELEPNSGILVVNINKSFDKSLTLEELFKKVAGVWEFGKDCLNAKTILFEHKNIIRLVVSNPQWGYITPNNIDQIRRDYTFVINTDNHYTVLDNYDIFCHDKENNVGIVINNVYGYIKENNSGIMIPKYIVNGDYKNKELNEKYLGMKIVNMTKAGKGLRLSQNKSFL